MLFVFFELCYIFFKLCFMFFKLCFMFLNDKHLLRGGNIGAGERGLYNTALPDKMLATMIKHMVVIELTFKD